MRADNRREGREARPDNASQTLRNIHIAALPVANINLLKGPSARRRRMFGNVRQCNYSVHGHL